MLREERESPEAGLGRPYQVRWSQPGPPLQDDSMLRASEERKGPPWFYSSVFTPAHVL